MKALTFNYNTTEKQIEQLKTGDRLTIEESGKVGGVYSVVKKDLLYTITLISDKGLFFEVVFKRPTTTQLENTISSIESDGRFAVCQQRVNGVFEVSVFYTPTFISGNVNRKEIKQTICTNASYTIAYNGCFKMFKKWLSANGIIYQFDI